MATVNDNAERASGSAPAPLTLPTRRLADETPGAYRFIEHVAAPRGSWLRHVQWLARPCYACCLDGCHTDREIWRTIADAGFARVQLARFHAHPGVATPTMCGVAMVG